MTATKVLIVDDDKDICELLKYHLDKEQYKVFVSQDGNDAVEKFKTVEPDIALLDIMLAGMDGWQVCREVRRFSNVPIIMITSKTETFDKVLGLELGADDYIVKPFDVKEVLARVRAILRRIEKNSENPKKDSRIVEYENLVINMTRYELRISGAVVDCPPKEIELLFFLASNPNRVYSRDQLLDEVWGFEYYGDSRTIDVHIKRLREKLDGVSDKWLLKTVWGVGYKFEADDSKS
ncbi:DNA-binding response regulator [Clostridia bacterium]|nr:DNA-binding response regulator [Clostridia bacterium]